MSAYSTYSRIQNPACRFKFQPSVYIQGSRIQNFQPLAYIQEFRIQVVDSNSCHQHIFKNPESRFWIQMSAYTIYSRIQNLDPNFSIQYTFLNPESSLWIQISAISIYIQGSRMQNFWPSAYIQESRIQVVDSNFSHTAYIPEQKYPY
jgi:hypothetical protein